MIIDTAHAGVISDAPSLTNVGINVLQFMLSTVAIIAIIMLVISGTMYFFAYGDMRIIHRAKKSATYAIVGIIISLSALVIVRLLGSFFQ